MIYALKFIIKLKNDILIFSRIKYLIFKNRRWFYLKSKKNFFKRLTMPLEDLQLYYRLRRLKAFEENNKVKGIAIRKFIHNILIFATSINRKVNRNFLHILSDKRKKENIDWSKQSFDNCKLLTEKLRDILAALRWDIWSNFSVEKRSRIPYNYSQIYINSFKEQLDDSYSLSDVLNTAYYDKNIVCQKDAFEHLGRLILCKENAFLFRGK